MSVALQGPLLDGIDDVGLQALDLAIRHRALAQGAWIDILPGWLTGRDELFIRLSRDVPSRRLTQLRQPAATAASRCERLTAEMTALNEAVTMLASRPTPHSTRSPSAHST
jgi:hypothetical protein